MIDLYMRVMHGTLRQFEAWLIILLTAVVFLGCTAETITTQEKNFFEPSIQSNAEEHVLFPVRKDGYWGFVDRSGNFVINPQFDKPLSPEEGTVYPFIHDLYPVMLDGSVTVITRSGEPLFPPGTFLSVRIQGLAEGAAIVQDESGSYGLISAQGVIVVPPQYDNIRFLDEGMAAFLSNQKWGYLNLDGGVAIPPQFDMAGAFSEGRALVKSESKYGYIDTSGAYVVEAQYMSGSKFHNGYARIQDIETELWGSIDRTGEIVVPVDYEYVGPFQSSRAAILREGLYGYVDTAGNEVIPPVFESVGHFSGNLANVERNGVWGYIDPQGTELTEFVFDNASAVVYGRGKISKNGLVGYVDSEGRMAIPPQYEQGSDFSADGVTVVKQGGVFTLIDLNGDSVSNRRFDGIGSFVISATDSDDLYYDNYITHRLFGMTLGSWSDEDYDYQGFVRTDDEIVYAQSSARLESYTVIITSLTVARTLLPLHASLEEIEIEINGRSYSINAYDMATNSLPEFATRKAMNTVELSLDGTWSILAQLSKRGIIQLEVQDQEGNVVTKREDYGYGAVVSIGSGQL